MSTSIVTISSDQKIRLENCGMARALSFGSDWDILRVGFRLSMYDSGASLPVSPNPDMFWGLCSGADAIVGPSGNPDHAVGFGHFGGIGWTRTPGAIPYQAGYLKRRRWVGASTNETVLSNPIRIACDNGVTNSFVGAQFQKGSPNWYVYPIINQSSAVADISLETFRTAMRTLDLATAHALLGTANFAYTADTPVDEATDGYLDHVAFYWHLISPAVVITDVFATKFLVT